MENTDSKQKNSDEMTFREQIVYFLKLIRSIFVYQYRYDEVFDEDKSWRDVVMVIGVSTLISVILVQLTGIIIRTLIGFQSSGNSFQSVLDMLSAPAMRPSFIMVSSVWYAIINFLVAMAVSVAIGYCLQLWHSSAENLDNKEWVGLSLAIALVQAFRLIIIQPLSAAHRFSTVFSSTISGIQMNPIVIILTIVIAALMIYSYYVLSKLIQSRNLVVTNFWAKFILIVLLMEGSSFFFSRLLSFILAPMYSFVLRIIL